MNIGMKIAASSLALTLCTAPVASAWDHQYGSPSTSDFYEQQREQQRQWQRENERQYDNMVRDQYEQQRQFQEMNRDMNRQMEQHQRRWGW
jgi:hypothetical protein